MEGVPFELVSDQIPFVVMDAQLAGRRGVKVLLDTGAAAPFTLIVSPELARGGTVHADAPPLPSSGAVGQASVAFQPARLRDFRLGPVRLGQVDAGVTPALAAVSRQIGRRIDAIVGQQFVRTRRISIDYRLRRVDFDAPAGPSRDAIPFTLAPQRPLTLVRAWLNGRGPFLLALDTGASATLLSPAAASAAGIEATGTAELGGAGGASAGGARLGTAEIRLGKMVRKEQRVAVADVLEPVRAAAGTALDGVLGADFLASGKIILDYPGKRLWIEGKDG